MFDLQRWSLANKTSHTVSIKQLVLTQPTLPVLLLLLSLVSCARSPVAEISPVSTLHPAVKCEHPQIDPRTKAGLYEAIRLYWGALEDCNARNGFDGTEVTPGALVGAAVKPIPGVQIVPATSVQTTVQKVTTKPTGATVSPALPSPLDTLKGITQ